MGRILNSDCGVMPATFFEKLASCIFIDPITGDKYLNTACYLVDCEDADPAIECFNNPPDPEQFCADNLFTTDSCGHMAFKLGACEKIFDQL